LRERISSEREDHHEYGGALHFSPTARWKRTETVP
jgi:hypothetical protein